MAKKKTQFQVLVKGRQTFNAHSAKHVAMIIEAQKQKFDGLESQDFLVVNKHGDVVPLVLDPHGRLVIPTGDKPLPEGKRGKPFSELAAKATLLSETARVDDDAAYAAAQAALVEGNPIPLEQYYEQKRAAAPPATVGVAKTAAAAGEPVQVALLPTGPVNDPLGVVTDLPDMPDADHLEEALQEAASWGKSGTVPQTILPAHQLMAIVNEREGYKNRNKRVEKDLKRAALKAQQDAETIALLRSQLEESKQYMDQLEQEGTKALNERVERDEYVSHEIAAARQDWEEEHSRSMIEFGLIPTKVLAEHMQEVANSQLTVGEGKGDGRVIIMKFIIKEPDLLRDAPISRALKNIHRQAEMLRPPKPSDQDWNF